jgi:PAS domain S-box-containing protein
VEPKLREQRHRALEHKRVNDPDTIKGVLGGSCVRVLLVDDNADDRALVARELRQEIPNLQIVEAADRSSFRQALESGSFDALVTDYQLRWTHGLNVLASVRARWPDLPAVMFTGTGSEEAAVDAMRAGVVDYVLKEPRYYPRLRASVKRALQWHDHDRVHFDGEASYKELFDTLPIALFKCASDGRILEANSAFAELVGFRGAGELVGRGFSQLQPSAEDFQIWSDPLKRDGGSIFLETRLTTKTGELRRVEIHAKLVRDPETGAFYVGGSLVDITVRKHAEAERDRIIGDLRRELENAKTLSGWLPICASCKRIRDAGGRWNVLESYIENHSHAHFTHGVCPECAHELYPEVFLDKPKF